MTTLPKSDWTDEELTELECVIDIYCQESAARGKPISIMGSWCPLYAVVGKRLTLEGMKKLGLVPESSHDGFWCGFDGVDQTELDDPHLYAMGRRFRERAIVGEYK